MPHRNIVWKPLRRPSETAVRQHDGLVKLQSWRLWHPATSQRTRLNVLRHTPTLNCWWNSQERLLSVQNTGDSLLTSDRISSLSKRSQMARRGWCIEQIRVRSILASRFMCSISTIDAWLSRPASKHQLHNSRWGHRLDVSTIYQGLQTKAE